MAVGLAFAPAGVTVGEAPFSPDQIAGLTAWYEADTLALADADPVSSWADSSGNGNTVVQASGTDQPIYKANIVNGLPVVRFVSNDALIKAFPSAIPSGTAPLTVVMVGSRGASTFARGCVMGAGTGSGWLFCHGDGANAAVGRFTTASVQDYEAAGVWTSASTFYVVSTVLDAGADVTFYRNSSTIGTATHTVFGNAGATTFSVGSLSNGWDGDIAELLIYDSDISANLATVENYLGEKYGLF